MSAVFDLVVELRDEARSSSLARLRAGGAAPTVELPPPVGRAGDDLVTAMAWRRSARFFADLPVPGQLVEDMLAAARYVDAALWPDLAEADPLHYYVAARAVSGLPTALYVADGPLRNVADLPDESALEEMVLQPEFARAPVLLLVAGSLEAASDGHGHRVMLERSGAACEAACLTAVSQGHVGSIFAGFLPSALRRLLSFDGFRRTQLLALAIGAASSAPSVDAVTSASS